MLAKLRYCLLSAAIWGSLVGFLGSPAIAASEQPIRPGEQEKAERLIRQFCSFLRSQNAFTVEADITYDNVLSGGQKVQYAAFQKVILVRPDRLRVEYTGDQRRTLFVYDGKSFLWLNTAKNLYLARPTASTVDAMVPALSEELGIELPLSNLVTGEPCRKASENIVSAYYVGEGFVGRTLADHILVIGKDRTWQLWLNKEKEFEPVPLKIVITYSDLPEAPQYTAVFSNWNFNPQITDKDFSTTPPEGALRIEALPTVSKP
ncbi:MAG: DUF2092 domain-containing protein [Gloeomargaritaceae cyanobacterium C42_A2020_066]|nr:DUF2092 domain-containing protein [Gloeomargaritaceae cyanobacterium C42_A2020_066]